MQIIIHNLKEILSNLECSSFNIAQNENELTLEQDFYILSNKEKVKVKFRDSQESSLKKLRTFNSSKKDQKELYEKLEYLNARFKEIPLLLLTAEAHHTLEVFEDYLLNNINERDSLSLSSFGPPKNSLFQDYKLGTSKKIEESEDDLEEELEIHEEEDDEEDVDEEEYDLNSDELHLKSNNNNNNMFPPKNQKENSLKSGFIFIFLNNKSNLFFSGSNSLKLPSEKMSMIPEPSVSLSERSSIKKTLIKKFYGKEINYRKNFEIDFFYNGTKLSKLSTIYSIIQKYGKKTKTFAVFYYLYINFINYFKKNKSWTNLCKLNSNAKSSKLKQSHVIWRSKKKKPVKIKTVD